MTKRRTVILGLGALTFGSGALSVNAAFNHSVDPTTDMRVVAARNLVVEAGEAFRDGSGNYDTSLDGSTGYNVSAGNENFFSTSNSSMSTGTDDELGGISPGDLPLISVSNDTNGALTVKLALLNNASTHTFENALQVRNDGDSSEDVGVKFKKFGVDTFGDQSNYTGAVDEDEVVSAFSFLDGSGTQISTDATHFSSNNISSVENQQVANKVTINSGATEQIDIKVSLTSSIVNQVASASNASGDPFPPGGDQDTVQLVQAVRFGV